MVDKDSNQKKLFASKFSKFEPAARQLMLPEIFPETNSKELSPLSNWVAKSAIFAPRPANKKREDTGQDWVTLNSPNRVQISYNGPLLDMNDQTLYLNLVKLAKGRGADEPITINRAELLRACGYKILGTSSYKWLTDSIDRLKQANLKIELDDYVFKEQIETTVPGLRAKFVTSLISAYSQLPNGDYYFTLPPSSLTLFSNELFGYNNMRQRRELKKGSRPELASWLQSYICADERGEHKPVKVETLINLTASKTRMDQFIIRLEAALENLKNTGVIKSWVLLYNDYREPMIQWIR